MRKLSPATRASPAAGLARAGSAGSGFGCTTPRGSFARAWLRRGRRAGASLARRRGQGRTGLTHRDTSFRSMGRCIGRRRDLGLSRADRKGVGGWQITGDRIGVRSTRGTPTLAVKAARRAVLRPKRLRVNSGSLLLGLAPSPAAPIPKSLAPARESPLREDHRLRSTRQNNVDVASGVTVIIL